MPRAAVVGVMIGVAVSVCVCLYAAQRTRSLSRQLEALTQRGGAAPAEASGKIRESVDQALKMRYSEQLASFARLAGELETEKKKAKYHAP